MMQALFDLIDTGLWVGVAMLVVAVLAVILRCRYRRYDDD